jgi:ribosome-associated protein
MILLEDTRQQPQKHKLKNLYFEQQGIEVRRTKLYCGDYTLPTNQSVCVDTKKDLQEIYGDLIGKQHTRFRAEADRAYEAGIKLIILIEDEEVKDLEGVKKWSNPRLHRYNKIKYMHEIGKWLSIPLPKKPPTDNITLYKVMSTFASKHHVEFVFCHPKDAGEKIIKLLGGEQ